MADLDLDGLPVASKVFPYGLGDLDDEPDLGGDGDTSVFPIPIVAAACKFEHSKNIFADQFIHFQSEVHRNASVLPSDFRKLILRILLVQKHV